MGAGGHSADGKGAVGPRMVVYRAVWRMFCGVLVVFGLVAAGLSLPAEILEVALLVALVAATMAASFYGSTGSGGSERARWTRRQVVIAAASASAAITLVLGLTVVL